MNFTFENQGTNTYLVYRIAESDIVDSMSLGMLTNNEIPGFVPANFTQIDTDKFIKYNVSSKVSATQLFSGAVNKKRLLGFISGLVDAMLAAEDYMLETESLLLDTDYIFTDVSTGESEMICLPIQNLEFEHTNLGTFLKNILFTAQFDTSESSEHVVKLLNYLNGAPTIFLPELKDLLGQLQGTSQQVQPKPQEAQTQPTHQPVPPVQPQQSVPQKTFMQQQLEQAQIPNSVPVQPPVTARPYAPQKAVPQPSKDAVVGNSGDGKKDEESNGEKKMSWFYLMQHYSKENAKIYKQQKENKNKHKKSSVAVSVSEKTVKSGDSGFVIPGQQPVSVAAAPAADAGKSAAPVQPAQAAPAFSAAQPQAAAPISFGETTVLGSASGETTVLNACAASAAPKPHLIRIKNNERIMLNKPVFRIGKERSYVDYFVGDNTAISRSHANIITRDGSYFILDTNSTNHTYLNGTMIPSNVETQLSHGSKIRLANEDFEFREY